jgi:ribokinase
MKERKLNFDIRDLQYKAIVGTGGIGSGKFFMLNGDQTLGREESRSGHFLDINDYCKQHIILHYIQVLLGPSFSVIPIGKLGDDDIGNQLFHEMKSTGFIMDHVARVPQTSTLFSFCFYYPDNSGGNLTTDNSASSLVDDGYIERVIPEIIKLGTGGLIMSAPEVPLSARYKLLDIGKKNQLFCTASFTSEEISTVLADGMLKCVDLLALNIDEASALAGIARQEEDTYYIVNHAITKLLAINRNIRVSVTAGKQGSICWDGHTLNSFPAIKTKAKSTAGAGDAFFAGLICGITMGLTLFEAQQLATLVAGLSVTSPHTIHKGIDRLSLWQFLQSANLSLSENIVKILED